MSTTPSVGIPTYGKGCAFAADLDKPACGEPSTSHMIVHAEGWGLVTLQSCERHAAIARMAGDLVSEHPFHADCATNDCIVVSNA